MDRYKTLFFEKRGSQNHVFAKFFKKIISKNKKKNFKLSNWHLDQLAYYDLGELAVAVSNPKLPILHEGNHDFACQIDMKCSVVRTHNYGRGYTAGISNCKNKKRILAVVLEPVTEKFYFFAFENSTGKAEYSIPFDPITCEPKLSNYMWCYEVPSFYDMALYFTK